MKMIKPGNDYLTVTGLKKYFPIRKGIFKKTIGHVHAVDDISFEVEKGDSWCIPGNTEHSAEILKDSVAIEVFSPVRKDYLPKNQ